MTLITPIFLAPKLSMTTVNSVCSSTGAAATAPPAGIAMATGAAAETPHFSSSASRKAAISMTVMLDRASISCSWVMLISILLEIRRNGRKS